MFFVVSVFFVFTQHLRHEISIVFYLQYCAVFDSSAFSAMYTVSVLSVSIVYVSFIDHKFHTNYVMNLCSQSFASTEGATCSHLQRSAQGFI
jgi:hypothetical protein